MQDAFVARVFQRLNEAAAPYLVFYSLGDGDIFTDHKQAARYCPGHIFWG